MENSNDVKERIKKQVLEEYQKYDTELNGDDIEFISGIELNYQNIITYGVIVPYEKCADLFNNSLIPETMTIIDAIAEIEKFGKIYRIFDMKTWENGEGDTIVVNGEVLSFIW